MSDKTGPSTYTHQELAIDLANRFQEELDALKERIRQMESHVHDVHNSQVCTSKPLVMRDGQFPEPITPPEDA